MKQLLVLFSVLVALIVIAWAAGMFGGPATTIDLPDLAVDAGSISEVAVTNGNDNVRANRLESGEWQLEEPVQAQADTATVMRFVRQVEGIKLESIVSSNPDRFSRFQVDSTANRFSVKTDDRELSVIVGKMGPDFQSRYVRLDGDDRIMLATGVPGLSAKTDQWRDKTLWTVPQTAVTNVSVTNETGTFEVVNSETGWHITSGAEELAPDTAEVASFIGRLSTMKADGFLPSLTVDSVLSGVTNKLQIEFSNGKTETLYMSKRKNDVAAVHEGSNDVLKFYTYRLTNLTPALDKLSSPAASTEAP